MRYFAALIIIIVFLASFLFDDWLVLNFRSSSLLANVFNALLPADNLKERIKELEVENENLRVQIFQSSISHPTKVKVYSSYPFNTRKEISLAGGQNLGFQTGDVVVLGSKILVGQIKKVLSSTSIAKTIYDPNWEIAVRIGEKEIDGLLRGGLNPEVDLIKADAEVKAGDIVITASPDLPYGLEIGYLKTVKKITGNPFQKAEVELKFQINELRDVSVYR
jgi:cell shape-determining protein MreC